MSACMTSSHITLNQLEKKNLGKDFSLIGNRCPSAVDVSLIQLAQIAPRFL